MVLVTPNFRFLSSAPKVHWLAGAEAPARTFSFSRQLDDDDDSPFTHGCTSYQVEPLKAYLAADKPFLGICLGMQLLFDGSDESPGVAGLGVIPGHVTQFDVSTGLTVPHMGWSGLQAKQVTTRVY